MGRAVNGQMAGPRTDERAGRALAPWERRAAPWVVRLTLVRFALAVPLVALLLVAAARGELPRPDLAFLVALGASSAHVLAFALVRGERRSEGWGRAVLFGTLLVDILFLAGVAAAVGSAAWLVLLGFPPLVALYLLAPRAAGAIAGLALAAVFLAPLGPVPEAAARDRSPHPPSPHGGPLDRVAVAAAVVLLFGAGHFAGRRMRFLEECVRERRAHAPPPRPPPAPPTRPLAAVARAVARELLEPTAAVRARAENLGFHLRERRGLHPLRADVERLLRAADRLDDARLTLAVLAQDLRAEAGACTARDVVEEVRREWGAGLELEGVRLRVHASGRARQAACSHNELRVVVVRLVDAARRAARSRRRSARVRLRLGGDDPLRLVVEDPFPAPPGDPDDWFDPSFSPRGRPSLGLALAVVRAVAERRGGAVRVERGEPSGLRVVVELPVADRREPVGAPGVAD